MSQQTTVHVVLCNLLHSASLLVMLRLYRNQRQLRARRWVSVILNPAALTVPRPKDQKLGSSIETEIATAPRHWLRSLGSRNRLAALWQKKAEGFKVSHIQSIKSLQVGKPHKQWIFSTSVQCASCSATPHGSCTNRDSSSRCTCCAMRDLGNFALQKLPRFQSSASLYHCPALSLAIGASTVEPLQLNWPRRSTGCL